ncbi:hypothetical protein B0G62_105145 [Paraburkholderia eburnea]|uniref:Sugar ABC transporter ATPase n=2 Tax=Paraburkholderia eburnea TaxID=1189126 RepID=A0A2S4MCL2_9BURK|nr:hypothetical protein B0G62_105145 [Paraburkholderia eburnea]PRZ23068.1 hypothetical protein BX588_105145 [Paraburkholderia eburnea]
MQLTGERVRILISTRNAPRIASRSASVTPLMNTLTQRLIAALPLALIAACGSSPSSTASNGETMIYASSARSPSSIASCLEDRLSSVHEARNGNAMELSVGSRSEASYFVTLTPNGYGSVIRVTHGASSSDDPPEAELRFDVARCTT